MAWVRYTHASVNARNPRAFGNCDRCDFTYNLHQLRWQYQWQGPKLQNLRLLVCPTCYDKPQQQLRTIIIPPDPLPVMNARQDGHMYMGQMAVPDGYQSGSPNVLTTISTISSSGAGNWLTTESTIPLITEINVTPTPSSSGYING